MHVVNESANKLSTKPYWMYFLASFGVTAEPQSYSWCGDTRIYGKQRLKQSLASTQPNKSSSLTGVLVVGVDVLSHMYVFNHQSVILRASSWRATRSRQNASNGSRSASGSLDTYATRPSSVDPMRRSRPMATSTSTMPSFFFVEPYLHEEDKRSALSGGPCSTTGGVPTTKSFTREVAMTVHSPQQTSSEIGC